MRTSLSNTLALDLPSSTLNPAATGPGPLVLSPRSIVVVTMLENTSAGGVLWCDGRRSIDVGPGSEVTVRRSPHKLLLARTSEQPFVHRLVKKFDLPIHGWRGQAERNRAARKPVEVEDAD